MQNFDDSAPQTVMLYSHDSVGLGHTRRNRELAHALSRGLPERTGRSVTGLLVSSLEIPDGELPVGFDAVRLPAIRKVERSYRPQHLRLPLESVVDLRAAVLGATVRELRPGLLIIDRHPFGIGGELLECLRRLQTSPVGARTVLGLRDVLDAPGVVRNEWRQLKNRSQLVDLIDAVWVYGDPAVHDIRNELPKVLAEKVVHTGYLSQGRRFHDSDVEQPFVLTTVGGGLDGLALCREAARAQVPSGHRHLIVAGPQMPAADLQRVRQLAGQQVEVVAEVPDVHALIRKASAVVSMVGYNTACEVLNTSVPALFVPREEPRLEQRIRADAFAARGVADVLPIAELSHQRIGGWMQEAVGRRVDRDMIDRDGLATVPGLAADLLVGKTKGADLAV